MVFAVLCAGLHPRNRPGVSRIERGGEAVEPLFAPWGSEAGGEADLLDRVADEAAAEFVGEEGEQGKCCDSLHTVLKR